jgi:hypothetical protein
MSLEALVDTLGFTLEAVPESQNPHMKNDGVEMDHWLVTLNRNGESMQLFFSQGIGHRRKPTRINPRKPVGAQMIPVKPKLASVLHCLLSDSTAIDQTFTEWCCELDCDTDSRSALDTYELCQNQGREIQALLGDDFESVREASWDY